MCEGILFDGSRVTIEVCGICNVFFCFPFQSSLVGLTCFDSRVLNMSQRESYASRRAPYGRHRRSHGPMIQRKTLELKSVGDRPKKKANLFDTRINKVRYIPYNAGQRHRNVFSNELAYVVSILFKVSPPPVIVPNLHCIMDNHLKAWKTCHTSRKVGRRKK